MTAGFTQILLSIALISGLVYYVTNRCGSGDEKKQTRPNFIIILADDIGWGDLGINLPGRTSHTPNLDLMAQQGIRFTDFHSPASTCSPSRAAILTGRHGLRTGVTHNFAVGSIGGLPLNESTLAEVLQGAGYYTAMVGFDYYLGIPYSNDMGCTDAPGFDFPLCPPCSSGIAVYREKRGCYSKVALPLFENLTIIEQPLDLWTLAEMYTTTAVRILHRSSGLDIFPTVLSLAEVEAPSNRRYDGIDATDTLLHGSETGRKSVLHPNSGAAGQFGDLQAVRLGQYKAFYVTGAAEACGGGRGRQELHDPPLIFDLSQDEGEGSPLDSSTAEYQSALEQIEQEREAVMKDIASDHVSHADYSVDPSAVPCCNSSHINCRCRTRTRQSSSTLSSKHPAT
ncbi:arylsulfatase G-like [Scleropages formosus]|uniref:Arylsulfatase G-like n=1 Tax=Scleropages formosus TaxID=113540 RepID=A0A0P7YDC8_SCLFO|nr:arylsulfatase G-like [Scleropages formosus]